MPSSVYPWDFQRAFEQDSCALEIIICEDPYLQRAVVQILRRLGPEALVLGPEDSWPGLADRLLQRGLFSRGPSTYLVLETKGQELLDFLAKRQSLDDRVILFLPKAPPKEFQKNVRPSHREIKILTPPFWMNGRLLLFFLEHMGLARDPSLKGLPSFPLHNKDLGPREMARALSKIKLQTPAPTFKEVISHFTQGPKDHLCLSALYTQKKFFEFYRELLRQGPQISQAISFTESRLLKLRYPSYQKSKKKLSRYDQSVTEDRKKWSPYELDGHLQSLHHLEVQMRGHPSRGLLELHQRLRFFRTVEALLHSPDGHLHRP